MDRFLEFAVNKILKEKKTFRDSPVYSNCAFSKSKMAFKKALYKK